MDSQPAKESGRSVEVVTEIFARLGWMLGCYPMDLGREIVRRSITGKQFPEVEHSMPWFNYNHDDWNKVREHYGLTVRSNS